MAKKKSKSAATPVVDAVPAQDEDEDVKGTGDDDYDDDDATFELLQVDVGDIVKLKQVLDEAVAGAMIDGAPNLDEDYAQENIKLSLMTVACLFAVAAQFGPIPFPDDRWILGGCCIAYFVMSFLLQLVVTFVEKDCIMITKPPGKGGYEMKDKGLRVRTSLPRFEEFYTVVLEYEGVPDSPFVKETWSVGNMFDKEGMFDEIYLAEEVEKLTARFEKRKYDKPDDAGGAKQKTS